MIGVGIEDMSLADQRSLSPAPLAYTRTAHGLGQYSNGDVALCGGKRSLSLGPSGTDRLRFAVFDLSLLSRGATRAEVGVVEANVLRGSHSFEGLAWIEIFRPFRRRGIASRVVLAVAATAAGAALRVYGIDRRALPFWDSVGCELDGNRGDRHMDGRIPAQAS